MNPSLFRIQSGDLLDYIQKEISIAKEQQYSTPEEGERVILQLRYIEKYLRKARDQGLRVTFSDELPWND